MRISRRIAGSLPVALIATAALAMGGCQRISAWLHPGRCVLSERMIHAEMEVRLAVVGENKAGKGCCLRCAITYSQQTGRTVRIFSVTDYPSRKPMRPDQAIYVTGSDVAPCAAAPTEVASGRRRSLLEIWDRCELSSIAFARREDAQAFQQVHGGRIETFRQVVGSSKVVAAR